MEDSYRHKGMRRQLVKLIRSKGVRDESVLAAMEKVPRHYFFENALVEHAYEDKAFPIGEGQTISQPYTVAYQTELLQVKPGNKVLEIGTGSGYQAIILSELKADVYTIEYRRKLYERTRRFLTQLGYSIYFFCGDGSVGLRSHAPFDRIIATAGAPHVPDALVDQLNINGILVIPVGNSKVQKMLRIIKLKDNRIRKETFHEFRFVPLLGEGGWR